MAETLTIRATTVDDLSEIDALFGRSYPALLKNSYPPSLIVTAIPLIARAQPRLLASGSYFAVIDSDGVIVGAGGWSSHDPRRQTNGAPATGHIRHVVTDHRRVRKGIGRALMGHVFDTARAAGMTRLDCLSTRMAVPFYAACGFEAVQPVLIALRAGIDFPAVLMQRSL
jgi:GNAT superfamily N-acetyltransferase